MDFKTFTLQDLQKDLADGVILPSGKVAVQWIGDERTFVVYPSFEDFKSIQDKQERIINFGGYAPDGYHLTTFSLVREEDVTGISGEGTVAYGCHFHFGAVLEWDTEIKSIAYYPQGIGQIERLHGHSGKTIVKMDVSPSW